MKAIFERFVDFNFFHQKEQFFFFHIDKFMKNHDDSENILLQIFIIIMRQSSQIYHLQRFHDGEFSYGMTYLENSG